MQKRGVKLLLTVLFFSILWFLLLIARLLFVNSDNENRDFIPQEASNVLILNGDLFVRQSFEEVVVQHRDNDIIQLILNRLRKDDSDIELDLGIEVVSDIIFYTIEQDKRSFSAVLFNLNRPEAFSSSTLR